MRYRYDTPRQYVSSNRLSCSKAVFRRAQCYMYMQVPTRRVVMTLVAIVRTAEQSVQITGSSQPIEKDKRCIRSIIFLFYGRLVNQARRRS